MFEQRCRAGRVGRAGDPPNHPQPVTLAGGGRWVGGWGGGAGEHYLISCPLNGMDEDMATDIHGSVIDGWAGDARV